MPVNANFVMQNLLMALPMLLAGAVGLIMVSIFRERSRAAANIAMWCLIALLLNTVLGAVILGLVPLIARNGGVQNVQAIYMANAGGAWDNAKKIVEVDLKKKGTPLHAATVVGDTVGDPFKDTSSVAMNPIIKFTTLFGLLAVEIAVELQAKHANPAISYGIGGVCFLVALIFAWRSFYCMRIPVENKAKH